MAAQFICFPPQGLMQPIFEDADIHSIPPLLLDLRLEAGWRHFGEKFFRYNFALHGGVLCGVVPLRLPVDSFTPSKSQRRLWRRNAELTTRLIPTRHCAEYDRLFERHKVRFTDHVPDSLRDFLSLEPASTPCPNFALEVHLDGQLVAVSFIDIGEETSSSVYGIFDPDHGGRSLGIFTLLLEIEHARRLGKQYHYLGYAYTVPSAYDYKKRFVGGEGYDWGRGWTPLPPNLTWSRHLEPTTACD
jgi:arginine-tRNA-protein transferase